MREINPIDVNQKSNYWQLYTKKAAARQFGAGEPPKGTTGAAGFQAHETGFDWRNLDKYDTKLTGVQQPATQVPSVEAIQINPFAEVEPVTQVAPAATIAQGGDQQLQKQLAGLGIGELTPNVNSDQLRHLGWA